MKSLGLVVLGGQLVQVASGRRSCGLVEFDLVLEPLSVSLSRASSRPCSRASASKHRVDSSMSGSFSMSGVCVSTFSFLVSRLACTSGFRQHVWFRFGTSRSALAWISRQPSFAGVQSRFSTFKVR